MVLRLHLFFFLNIRHRLASELACLGQQVSKVMGGNKAAVGQKVGNRTGALPPE